jgi:uncharacterized membrane protein
MKLFKGSRKDRPPPLARALGWFSLALGIAQVSAPSEVNRLIGVKDTPLARTLQYTVGVRELAAGAGILTRRRPVFWLWSRVAGDAMDLALLSTALGAKRTKRAKRKAQPRTAAAIAAVSGIAALDIIESVRLSRRAATTAEDGPMQGTTDGYLHETYGYQRGTDGHLHGTTAVTVRRPIDEVYRFWHDFENLPRFMSHLQAVHSSAGGKRSHWRAKAPAGLEVEWEAEITEDAVNEHIAWHSLGDAQVENSGCVRFAPAPADRGTEVTVELDYSLPGGAIGAAVAKLFGEEPVQQMRDDLHRFKQVMESGEVIRSEASPEGIDATRLIKQRPAQPVP